MSSRETASPGRSSLSDVAHAATAPVPNLARMEAAFGTSLQHVKVAAGTREARSALAPHNANAAAVGDRLVFAERDPSAELVGHELAHVVQQGSARVAAHGKPVAAGDAEAEAHLAGQAAARGEPVAIAHRATRGVPQFDLRQEAKDQNAKRGQNPAQTAYPGPTHDFSDMAKDDTGPVMHHDHGFLDDGNGNIDESKRQSPTWRDTLERSKWIAKLEAAELLRPDLVDGTAAYRHFLFGNGATRDVHYERFLNNDNAGHVVHESAVADARDAAMRRNDSDLAGKPIAPGSYSYHIRTGVIGVGGADGRYPYPSTENWQKAIGAHSIWIEANVTVTVAEAAGGGFERRFHVDMTIHAEDMYNFNPGNADIATGTPDAANGRFEITGLGHEYLNRGTYRQAFDFTASTAPAPAAAAGAPGPTVQPGRETREGRAEGSRTWPGER